MMRTIFVCLLLTSVWALIPGASVASGQSRKEKAEEAAKRSIEGVVMAPDSDQPVEGAIVQLKDMKSLQVRSFVTKQDGRYHFYGLSINNDYEVKSEFQGAASKTRMLSVYDARKKAIMDLKLEKK
jgi:hypothetical protein